ncbi:selenide, water dikinase SelD [Oceanicaulis sp.]|uniref:selenide, water dikinase SelD n=1 Tax=Oceanicaulis sp. TaxID=1924941 RepID=UPI003F6E6819
MTETPSSSTAPSLTSLARGGGCGCKLDPAFLDRILADSPPLPLNPALLLDAATRDDAAVYKINDEMALVATTDFFAPVVDDPYDFGRIAATNALSDVYAMGAKPIFCLAVLGMPINVLPPETIRQILDGGRSVAESVGAPVAGGHSIDAAEPFYGLVALGLAHPDQILTNAGAKPGDVLILGKPLGVGVFSAAQKRGLLTPDDYDAMIATTTRLNTPGSDLAGMAGVHAVTDVTGFGLLGHLSEMCRGSKLAAQIDRTALPVFDGARRLLNQGVRTGASGRNWAAVERYVTQTPDWSDADRDMLCDPQTSGGLLVACAPDAAAEVLATFHKHGHSAAVQIGRLDAGDPMISFSA